MTRAYLNRIGTAVPDHDIHAFFAEFAQTLLAPRDRRLFARMTERAGIAHRFSPLRPGDVAAGEIDAARLLPPRRVPRHRGPDGPL